MGGEREVKLPENWRTLSSRKLFLDYQRQAFKAGDKEMVVLIGEEMRRRLKVKGLVKTRPFGWVSVKKIANGLESNLIKENADGSFTLLVRYVDVYDKQGRKIGSKPDYSKFKQWLTN